MISNNQILTSVDSDEPVQPFLSLETPNDVQLVAQESKYVQATRKGSDWTARMHRLVSHTPHCWKSHVAAEIVSCLLYLWLDSHIFCGIDTVLFTLLS